MSPLVFIDVAGDPVRGIQPKDTGAAGCVSGVLGLACLPVEHVFGFHCLFRLCDRFSFILPSLGLLLACSSASTTHVNDHVLI